MKRPTGATLLFLLIVLLGSWNALRLVETFYNWRILIEYGAQPLYIAISSWIWFLSFVFLLWYMWRRNKWVIYAFLGVIACYFIWSLIDQVFIQHFHSNLSFSLASLLIAVIITFLFVAPKRIRFYFKREL
jgi:hypothetical protein